MGQNSLSTHLPFQVIFIPSCCSFLLSGIISSVWRTSFSISLNVGVLSVNSFIFCLFDSAFIFLYFWRILFLGLEMLCQKRFFLHFKDVTALAFDFHCFYWNVSSPSICSSFEGDMSFFSRCFEDFTFITHFLAAYYDKTKFSILIYPVWSLLSIMNLWDEAFCHIWKFFDYYLYKHCLSHSFSLFYLYYNHTYFNHVTMFHLFCVLFFPTFIFFHVFVQIFYIGLSSSLLSM